MLIFALLAGYAVLAVGITVFKRYRAAQFFKTNPDLPEKLTKSVYYKRVSHGRTVPQVLSMLSHILLIVIPAIALASKQLNLADPAEHVGVGFLLVLLTLVTIIANAFWIYPQSIIYATQYAHKTRTAFVLVRIQELLAVVVWGTYTFYAVWLWLNL